MPDKPVKQEPYLKRVMHFYFSPDLRSVGTLVYMGVFGYFTLYYIDNLVLAVRFMFYVVLGNTVLSDIAFLFIGMAFMVSLIMPFLISFYAIFILHKVWDNKDWAAYVKWLITALVIAVSFLIVITSDRAAHIAGRQPSMQSFIEDTNLTSKV